MLLKSIFQNDYFEVPASSDLAINEFVETRDSEGLFYAKPISSIYLHNNMNEMFIVLDCKGYNSENLFQSISDCETRMLTYVNFGESLSDHKNYLKFNTSLLIIADENLNSNIKYEIEKSKRICRKIIITVNDNEELKANEKVMIPFCFEFNEGLDLNSEIELTKQLEKLFPNDKNIKDILLKNKSLTENDCKIIIGWLENE